MEHARSCVMLVPGDASEAVLHQILGQAPCHSEAPEADSIFEIKVVS